MNIDKLANLLEIITRNLGNALVTTASEIRKLNNSEPPLSQASEKPEFASIIAKVPHKRFAYDVRDKVIVKYPDQNFPIKSRILKRLSETEYLVYSQGGLKSQANQVSYDQILGIDPDS